VTSMVAACSERAELRYVPMGSVYGQVRIRSQGKHYELPHAFLLQIDESGLIKEVAAYWDNASFYSQLGKTTLD